MRDCSSDIVITPQYPRQSGSRTTLTESKIGSFTRAYRKATNRRGPFSPGDYLNSLIIVFLISRVAQTGANTIIHAPIIMTMKDFVYKTVEGLDVAATVYWPQTGLENPGTKLPIGKMVQSCLN
jgi:hypothetical protein